MSVDTITNKDYLQAKHCTDLDHIPGNYGMVPYVGNTIALVTDLFGFVDKNYKKYGEISKISVGGIKGLLVLGPDNFQQVYLDKTNNFSAQMGYEYSLAHYYRGALLLRDFDEHKVHRRLFQTAFKTEPMRSYVDIINPMLKMNLDSWEGQKDFRFFPAIKKALLEVGASVFIGVKELGPEMDKLNEAFLNISEKGLLGLFKVDLPGFKHHKGKQGERYLQKYFEDIIPKRREGDGDDILSYMSKEKMDNGEYYPVGDLVPQASFLLFAAHDTTTSTLNQMLLLTAQNPEWQTRLREESRALGKAELSFDDLDNLHGLEMVFKETLRLSPSVPMMTRRTINDCEMGGHHVPANTQLFIVPIYNHYMKEYWSDPFTFDPERFSAEREEFKSHSFAYMPFGGGAHKCIGMHFASMIVKCFMHQFLLKYEYSVPENYAPRKEYFPLPKTADGLKLILKPIA